jgi:hypothetical protein
MGTPMAYISGNTGDFSSGSFNRATVALNLQNQLVSGYNWWNGVDVTASQYLIYSDLYSQGQSTLANSRPTAWTTPDLTDASLLALINTLPDRVGLPPYTDVNLALNWLQATNKYFLIKTGYENISTTNLSINLDAGWYTSYSGGTSWRDIVGNGDNGVLTNGPVFTASAQGVISFDGTDDYVVVSPVNTITLNDYTMEVWFNIASLPSKRQYLMDPRGNGTENNSPIYFLFDDNGSQINIIGGNSNIEVSSGNFAVQTNTWYHAICTRNGSTCTLYFNGVKVGEGNTGSSPLTIYHPFRVATYAGGTSGQYFFNGKISMARIYSNGFSGSDVQKNYNSQRNRFGLLDVVQNGLISSIDAGNFLSYPTTGTVWKDLSGYEDNFTLTNGPTWNSSNGGFITFDGTDDYCATAAGAPFYQYTNKLSVSWWMKRNGAITGGAGGGQSTIGVDGMSTNVWLMHGGGTSMTFYVNDSGSWVSLDSGTIPDNTWTHLVATVSNTATKFYVNGVLINDTSGVSQITINPNSIIGWGFDPRYLSGRFFNGSIHSAQVYNRELSSDEVYQNYSTNVVLDGSTSTKAAPSANYLWNNGVRTNGLYYIRTTNGVVQLYCDFTTLDEDGTSGWMHVGTISDDGGSSNNPTTMPWGYPLNPAQNTGIWQDTNTLNEGSPSFTTNYKNRAWYSSQFTQLLIKDQGATQRNLLYTKDGQITENNDSLANWFGSLLWDAEGSENSNTAYQNGNVTGLEIVNFSVIDPLLESGNKSILLFKFGEKDGVQDANKDRVMIAWPRYNASDNVDLPAGIGTFTNRSGTIDYRNVVPYEQRQDYPYPTITGGPYNYSLWVK